MTPLSIDLERSRIIPSVGSSAHHQQGVTGLVHGVIDLLLTLFTIDSTQATGEHRGFAFVDFQSAGDANEVVRAFGAFRDLCVLIGFDSRSHNCTVIVCFVSLLQHMSRSILTIDLSP